MSMSLRKCRVCGLEAWIEFDLQKFEKNRRYPFSRKPLCKECHNKRIREKRKKQGIITSFTHKKNKLLKTLPLPLFCYFCGMEITKLHGKDPESLCFHSLDGNHDNWNPKNKVPTHKKCHNSYHTKNSSPETRLKISLANSGDKCYKWKGDNAKKETKKYRKYSIKRRNERIKHLLDKITSN